MNLSTLRDRVDPFLAELGTLEYRFGAGLASELPVRQLYSSYSEFSLPETFVEVRQAAERSTTDDRERRLLRLMLEFLANQIEESLAASSIEAIASLEATGFVTPGTERVAFTEAVAGLSRDNDRARRAAVERAIGEFLWGHQEVYAQRWEAAQGAAQTLKFRSYVELRDAVTSYRLADLASECAGVLKSTEDAYRDILS